MLLDDDDQIYEEKNLYSTNPTFLSVITFLLP